MKGALPWQNTMNSMTQSNIHKLQKEIGIHKSTIPVDDLCKGCPEWIHTVTKSILHPNATPEYSQYIHEMKKRMKELGTKFDYEYDWTSLPKRVFLRWHSKWISANYVKHNSHLYRESICVDYVGLLCVTRAVALCDRMKYSVRISGVTRGFRISTLVLFPFFYTKTRSDCVFIVIVGRIDRETFKADGWRLHLDGFPWKI